MKMANVWKREAQNKTQNKAISAKNVYFWAKLALEFHPKVKKLDYPTSSSVIL